jgi:hypothetical protein
LREAVKVTDVVKILCFLLTVIPGANSSTIDISVEFLTPGQYPDIKNGLVVFNDRQVPDVYGLNLATGTHIPICTHSGQQYRPKTNGDIVVWADDRNKQQYSGVYDIYGYDINTDQTFEIAINPTLSYDSQMDIDGDIVVYSARPIQSTQGGDAIYCYNLHTRQESVIDNTGTCRFPKISQNRVIYNRGGSLMLYNLDTHERRTLRDSVLYYDIWDSWVTWTELRNGPYWPSVYVYNLRTNTETLVCSSTTEQIGQVAIDNGIIVFSTYIANNDRPIYGYDIYNKAVFPIRKDPGGISFYFSISGNNVILDGIYRAELPMNQIRCSEHPIADLNFDCRVDLADMAILAGQWLVCNLNPPELCL